MADFPTKPCRSCGAPLIWAVTEQGRKKEAVRALLEIGFDVGAETERNKAWEHLVKRAGELEQDEPDIANVLKAAAAMLDAREHLAGDENPFRPKSKPPVPSA